MSRSRWKKAKKDYLKLAPGVYVDQGEVMHLDLAELLEANGWPDNPRNRQMLIQAAKDMARQVGAKFNEADDV